MPHYKYQPLSKLVKYKEKCTAASKTTVMKSEITDELSGKWFLK